MHSYRLVFIMLTQEPRLGKVLFGIGLCLTFASLAPAAVHTGLDVLAANQFQPLQGKRVGLICNQGSIDRAGRPSWKVFHDSRHCRLVALFAPEHGIDGTVPAGKYVANRRHRPTGLMVYSLYGPTRKPTPAMLKDLDALVFDLQDLGVRSYTYISTMGLAMQAAAHAKIPFYVLDRPNPLGGRRVEGPGLDIKWRSFIGQYEIPYIHGLTVGELARWINASSWIGQPCHLQVVPMQGWSRSMLWSDTGLRWIPTSPNIPTADHAAKYAITGWLGETGTLSNGCRGPDPFGMGGAAWIDPARYCDALNQCRLPGVAFRPYQYALDSGQWKGATVRGVTFTFSDRNTAEYTAIGLHMLHAAQRVGNRSVFYKAPQDKVTLFNKATGGTSVRALLDKRAAPDALLRQWRAAAAKFRVESRPFLLYKD